MLYAVPRLRRPKASARGTGSHASPHTLTGAIAAPSLPELLTGPAALPPTSRSGGPAAHRRTTAPGAQQAAGPAGPTQRPRLRQWLFPHLSVITGGRVLRPVLPFAPEPSPVFCRDPGSVFSRNLSVVLTRWPAPGGRRLCPVFPVVPTLRPEHALQPGAGRVPLGTAPTLARDHKHSRHLSVPISGRRK